MNRDISVNLLNETIQNQILIIFLLFTSDKMTMKIIDNIQLTIRNIHIRWEENEHYSFGITLSEIVI